CDAPAGHAAAPTRTPAARAHAAALSRALEPPPAPDALGGATGAPTMNAGQQPVVSVVVPARNEERFLGRCLASITAQRWPDDDRLQIVVVENVSRDRTREGAPPSAHHARLQFGVVENGSRDRTREVAEAWATRDPRVAVVVSNAANHAVA